MGLKDFFDFQTDLGGVYTQLIKDSTPSVETKIKTKVHWLKVRQVKCAPSTSNQISIGVRYDVSSAFTNVIIGNLPKKTRAANRRDLILPQISEDRLPVSKALHKVSFLKVLINLLILKCSPPKESVNRRNRTNFVHCFYVTANLQV